MKLSNNFSLKEMTASQTATRHGINNNPNEDHMNNLKALCENVLQKVRDHFGKVVSVSSGYRSPELCLKIGSSVNSQHAKGEAADFEIFGVSNAELVKWISENCDFDQMILEFHNLDEPNSGWVHCSYKSEDNRKQILRAYKDENNKTKYEAYDPK
jgi:zinc D-Ala-D-Ala carboxypeptidase